ncbi:hypothetical protein L1987_86697 [Smallanthus sonchifolius]|uniref:Uncharacterized protein n=1 Tax=Smallanthus sonchifolius TaxID=185202 RepID=A0ACB8Y0S8_9ASTR|nr:hypothetical protein L1987_86697 [Smallanthus sonchifolius]
MLVHLHRLPIHIHRGKEFCTTVDTLTHREPHSMLAAMFSGRHTVCKDSDKVLNKKEDEETGADLTRTGVIKCVQLSSVVNVILRGVNLSGLDLSKLDLSGVDFSYGCLKNVNFSHANLQRAEFQGVDAENAIFHKTTLSQ